jgi:hypothetical protein
MLASKFKVGNVLPCVEISDVESRHIGSRVDPSDPAGREVIDFSDNDFLRLTRGWDSNF